MRTLQAALLVLLASPAFAQTTVALYARTAVDPNGTTPLVAPVQQPAACGQVPKYVEVLPIVNVQGFAVYDDPANPTTLDCVADFRAQLAVLPRPGTYKAAIKVGSEPFSEFSSEFSLAAQTPHPCDGAAPTTATVVEGTRQLVWCWDGKDANGNVTTLTQWAVYIGTTRTVLTNILAGSTVNAAGLRDYRASVPFTRGTYTLQYVAVNAVGESARSPTFTLVVQPPPAVPSAPIGRGAN